MAIKNKIKGNMEKRTIIDFNSFKDREILFKERTGYDFVHLYNKYYTKLVYHLTKICGEQQKAEDLATDSFMTSLSKIEKYDKEKSKFSTWIFTIGKNIALQDLKECKKSISIDMEFDNEGTTMKDFIKSDEVPTNKMVELNSMKGEIMLSHISKLKESYRSVIVMREIDKLSYEEIAIKMNENLNTIKSKIRNGRILLIKSTKKEFDKLDEMYS